MGLVLGWTNGLFAEPPPQRILIIGDSIMKGLSHSLTLELERKPGVKSLAFSSIGSGLARLDVFDWMQKIRELSAEFKPDAAIVLMGANDRQAMQINGKTIQPNQPEWDAEYERRVSEAMDLLLAGGAKVIYWIELPDMREEQVQANALALRGLQRAAAEKHPAVQRIASDEVLSRTPGQYSAYVVQPGSLPVMVRDSDGIHLTRAGCDLLAAHVLSRIWSRPNPNEGS